MTRCDSLTLALALTCAACGSPSNGDVIDGGTADQLDSSGDVDAVDDGPPAPEITFACPGGTVVPGDNQLEVDGRTRTFHAEFPTNTSGPMGLVFSWHGFGQAGAEFRAAMALDPDAVPTLPMVIVTPDDTGMLPPAGLDWDIAKGTAADANREIKFFEAMVGCFHAQHAIDPAAIYSFGFSAGAVVTNLLHSRYPKLVSAIVTASGAWFNDQAEIDLVNVFNIDWTWPDLAPEDGGAVLLTHGGPNDVTVLNILDLERSAQAALGFLEAGRRVVVDCAHTGGHTPHPEVTPALIGSFFAAHRAGGPSPYVTSYDGFPSSCTLRLPPPGMQ